MQPTTQATKKDTSSEKKDNFMLGGSTSYYGCVIA
ncbi:mating pheromone a TDEL_0B04780 [Torulaspora delbrueckii]|uniref:Uncharacterized protein n=1 Tax=Torulaspora delbrueckii TaxID=4950 RepID=G8ZPR3_TORDE|nr:hypothetical protein TDEL_0B04780 [Torulaspora delbrueckii]CCE90607.1 hypothetical protein TDEL_0B04780 [Torulaspora delbrueckii]